MASSLQPKRIHQYYYGIKYAHIRNIPSLFLLENKLSKYKTVYIVPNIKGIPGNNSEYFINITTEKIQDRHQLYYSNYHNPVDIETEVYPVDLILLRERLSKKETLHSEFKEWPVHPDDLAAKLLHLPIRTVGKFFWE